MRVRRIRGTEEALCDYPLFVAEPALLRGTWRRPGFSRLIAEFGGGKGGFIIEQARRNPDVDYLMVDVVPEILIRAVKKASKLDPLPHNLRFARIDLRAAAEYFADDEFDGLFLNFSDPWPKSGHYKRRLTYREFLAQYSRLLKPGAKLEFKTDNRKLFEFSLCEFSRAPFVLSFVSLDLHSNEPEDNVRTEYESKFATRGMPIYKLEAINAKPSGSCD
ncbi:MAG: tRNA (guanosine(46)-N7)-methyltransferase TrmB [Bacillota bacterium]|nr:tRNA (guanosine(46)-N7)-methyltransferase TrmB [Bacillota bacterium]